MAEAQPWQQQRALEAEADAETVRAMQLAANTLLRAIDSTTEHLSYWESLQKDTPGKRLRAVFMRRGPLPFAQSFYTLLSESINTPPLSSTLSLAAFTSHLPTSPQSLSQAASLARDFLTQAYSRIATVASSLSKRLNGLQPDQSGASTPNVDSIRSHSPLLGDAKSKQLQVSTPRHQQSEAFASAFVAERVRLLRTLKKQLLTALGEVWDAACVPGLPPLLSLDAFSSPSYSDSDRDSHRDSSIRNLVTLPSAPRGRSLQDMAHRCCRALEALQGTFDLPQERHGPFKTKTQSWSPGEDSLILLSYSTPALGPHSNHRLELGEARGVGSAPHSLLQHQARQLDLFVTMLLSHYKKPSRAEHMWMEYTAIGLGAVLATSWAAKHRGDFVQWYRVARDASTTFVTEHVWQPLLAIRDDLFLTFRPQRTSIVDSYDVQQTADSLHRMLTAFVSSSKTGTELLLDGSGEGAKLVVGGREGEGGDPSTSALMAILVHSYEKEVMRPLQGLVTGHLAQALLIQTQQMKLHVESALLEMEKILRANAINFAFLAALPALLLALAAAGLTRDWLLSRSKGSEGRGRAAQTARRMLLGQVERLVLEQLQEASSHVAEGARGTELQGRLLYALARLHRSVRREAQRTGEWARGVRREAQRTGEWASLERDIVDVARPDMDAQVKALLASRMDRLYECLTVSPERLHRVR